jgi:hypothetical protein
MGLSKFVSELLFSTVLASYSICATTASAFFRPLSLFASEVTDWFTLIYASLAFLISLCGLLKGPNHLFNSFHTLCNYFSTVLV